MFSPNATRGLLGLFLLSIVFLSSNPAFAQTTSTTILGTVADAAGAVVPGAKVTVTNTRTGLSRDVTASSTGDYSFPLLDVGVYDVTVDAEGSSPSPARSHSARSTRRCAPISRCRSARPTERVEVTANSSTLRTDDATLGQTDRAAARRRVAAEQPQPRRARDPAARRAVRAAQRHRRPGLRRSGRAPTAFRSPASACRSSPTASARPTSTRRSMAWSRPRRASTRCPSARRPRPSQNSACSRAAIRRSTASTPARRRSSSPSRAATTSMGRRSSSCATTSSTPRTISRITSTRRARPRVEERLAAAE